MRNVNNDENRRILIIDDNPAIHEDYRKILVPETTCQELQDAEAAFFGETPAPTPSNDFELEHAHQGEEALEKVVAAAKTGRPFAMAFVDMRMPPGWDGLETIEGIWGFDPSMQIVICTAYSDHAWSDITRRLGNSDQLLILKKPFDNSEVCQLAAALTQKWTLAKQARIKTCELNRLVDQQTAHIRQQERALRQKQKLEAIGSLAGGIAHEFNNLLQVINGYASFAMNGLPQGSECRSDLTHVLSATERGATLTDQLLSFSRRQTSQVAAIDISELLRETEGLLQPLIGEHINLIVEDQTKGVYAECDRANLQQAVLNLCNNSRDAMPQGGELKIKLSQVFIDTVSDIMSDEATVGDYAVITVTDTGHGMSAEVCDRVFEPFFTTKEVGESSGLGLAMVHGCVTQLGGHISVTSEPARGTTIELYFPAMVDSALHRKDQEQTSFARGSETILLAEDNPVVRGVLERVLTGAGYTVHATSDGEEAICAFEANPNQFDLLLLDIIMPGKSGIDVSEHLQQDGQFLPTVYCTSYTDDTPQIAQLIVQEANIVLKPVNPKLLLRTVRDALDAEPAVSEFV